MLSWRLQHSKPDILGVPFVAHTFRFNGPVSAVETTLVEYVQPSLHKRAILYLHGYTDYFFQDSLAPHFAEQGWQFFALDLQGYGRSIRPNSRPNWCEDLAQYHDDLSIALAELGQRGIDEVVLLAHSTGGLIASSYLQRYPEQVAQVNAAHPTIKGLILNSPFLELPFSPKLLKYLSLPIRLTVSLLPFHNLRAEKISVYAKTLHRCYAGEWSYRLDWKPSQGFPLSFHWLKQVMLTQKSLRQRPIKTPTLVCHSTLTTRKLDDVDATRKGDGVLDVASMTQAAQVMFQKATFASIDGGYHDLYLSPKPIRQRYLTRIDHWLAQLS
ncbi:alpha/beta hydrolase [Marinomonas ostreistagni]|uniref:alpha/beta hydrolase n=1 Tax=Marinomonas ostreistagni TaxID=359209 RepID=UPI0019505C27|nr:alpha/beta hydrolase [Marinomonas ostreistagni]MBM6551359.1 alpha/beta hydrolase [Marinomonas ostreistagni]